MSDDEAAESGDAEVEELLDRLEELEADFDEKIEDVRDRVIQVKREVDGKAADDHEHDELHERLDDIETAHDPEALDRVGATLHDQGERLEELEAKVETLASTMVEVRDDLEDEPDVESTVERQGETLEALEDRVEMLATSALKLLDWMEERNRTMAERRALDRLRMRANEVGVGEATCEDCGSEIRVGLLTEPACPHCGSMFSDVRAGGLLSSGEMVTGSPPAAERSDNGTGDEAVDDTESADGDREGDPDISASDPDSGGDGSPSNSPGAGATE